MKSCSAYTECPISRVKKIWSTWATKQTLMLLLLEQDVIYIPRMQLRSRNMRHFQCRDWTPVIRLKWARLAVITTAP